MNKKELLQAIKELKAELELEFENTMNDIERKTKEFKEYIENQDKFNYVISQGQTLESLRNEYKRANLIATTKHEVLDSLERKIIQGQGGQ